MLFNSIEYAIFLPIVFIIYWALKNKLTYQNALVLLVSYIFYGWWDWRFLGLIILTSFTTFLTGDLIYNHGNQSSKKWMLINVVFNLIILGFFKYFNFFSENLQILAHSVGLQLDWFTLKVMLPIGISFYTFQAISYSVDVYRGNLKPTNNILSFFSYIAFFPQLIAGPIEKATVLLPQFEKNREFDYDFAVDGMRQILWGLVKKILIADNCALYIGHIYANPEHYGGSSIIFAVFLFMFQIYGDFSGYSDIAIGTGKLFGIKLSANFNFPLFARDFSEFWRKWNMSLMRWFRDYVYIPLGGSRRGVWRTCLNVMIVFLLSGFWHGADWLYILWGVVNGLLIVQEVLRRKKKKVGIPTLKDFPSFLLVFIVCSFTMFVFQCHTIDQYINFLSFADNVPVWEIPTGKTPLFFIVPFLIVEWLGRRNEYAIQNLPFSRSVRWSTYWVLLLLLIYGTSAASQVYVYFQF